MRHGRRIGREPCPLASRIKALVWHDECMAEDVSRGPSLVWHDNRVAEDVSRDALTFSDRFFTLDTNEAYSMARK